jgi:hypothetical protein
MCFFILIPIISLLSLGLAYNKTGYFWNITTAQPIPTSSSFVSTIDNSSLEPVVIIQIQINNLSGSNIINLSSIKPIGFGDLFIPTSSTSSFPVQAEILFILYPNASLSNVTAISPYQTLSALNFNITTGYVPRPSVALVLTTSPIGLGLFTRSGI